MSDYIDISRAAIELAKAKDSNVTIAAAQLLVHNLGLPQALDYLDYHCLTPLCFEQYSQLPEEQQDSRFAAELKARTIAHIAAEHTQLKAMTAVHQALETSGIPYAFFKGSANRLYLYPRPYLRPAADVDVLVSPSDHLAAIEALMAAGLVAKLLKENLTHEITFMHGMTEVDLHWHILRPGRLVKFRDERLLENRILHNGYWCLSPHSGLLVQLVHPAFTKYVNSLWAKHIRLIDIEKSLSTQQINWDLLVDQLTELRGKTAAWCTLIWLQVASGTPIPPQVMQQLAPSSLKQWYLKRWILHGLVQKYFRHRFIMRLGLSLFLQDRMRDSLAAVFQHLSRQAKLEQETGLTRTLAIASKDGNDTLHPKK